MRRSFIVICSAIALAGAAFSQVSAQDVQCSIFKACDAVAAVEAKVRSQASEIAALKKEIADLTAKLSDMRTDLVNLGAKIAPMTESIKSADKWIGILESGFHIKNVSNQPECLQVTGSNGPTIAVLCNATIEQQRWTLTRPNG